MTTLKKIAAKAYDFSFKGDTYAAALGAEVDVPQELFDRLSSQGLWKDPPAKAAEGEGAQTVIPVTADYRIAKAGFGKVNVVDGAGKAVNEKPMSRDEGEKLLAELKANAETPPAA